MQIYCISQPSGFYTLYCPFRATIWVGRLIYPHFLLPLFVLDLIMILYLIYYPTFYIFSWHQCCSRVHHVRVRVRVREHGIFWELSSFYESYMSYFYAQNYVKLINVIILFLECNLMLKHQTFWQIRSISGLMNSIK